MAAPRYLPSDSILQRMVERGMTHQQIADAVSKETGVRISRSTVSAALSRAGLTNRVRYTDEIPWPVIKTEHNHHYALTMLRVRARIAAGAKVNDDMQARYESWLEKLDESNAVVAYVYDSPDGFYYVPRERRDGEGVIRKPDAPGVRSATGRRA